MCAAGSDDDGRVSSVRAVPETTDMHGDDLSADDKTALVKLFNAQVSKLDGM